MGNEQSKQAVEDGLQQLRISDTEEDYVEVGSDIEKKTYRPTHFRSEPGGLPLQLIAGWQTSLLDDPKNK